MSKGDNKWIQISKNNKPKKNKVDNHNSNNKKILCFNVLNMNTCSYMNKCIYAHSLEEQTINANRQKIYDLLDMDVLSHVDLIKESELFNDLNNLTKLCKNCVNNICPGGYNCKYGACNNKFLICYDDLHSGSCKNELNDGRCCRGIHLTHKGIIPYSMQKINNDFPMDNFFRNNDMDIDEPNIVNNYISKSDNSEDSGIYLNDSENGESPDNEKVIVGYRKIKSMLC
jgi:hypothetical protein